MKILKTLRWASLSGLLALLPQKAFALSASDLPGWGLYKGSSSTPSALIASIVTYVLYFVAAIAIAYLVYGGISYLTSAGNEDKVKAAKNIILTSIIGLAIIAIAISIVYWMAAALQTGSLRLQQ
ncbi:MAG: hypothetical protein NT135_00340 [Candidatus Berkelbacteria bacterium]|nr:hypothetical protein [Candidatus Berkelbacteria bacterium]